MSEVGLYLWLQSFIVPLFVPLFFLLVIACVIGVAFSVYIFGNTLLRSDQCDYNKKFLMAARIFLLSLMTLWLLLIVIKWVEL